MCAAMQPDTGGDGDVWYGATWHHEWLCALTPQGVVECAATPPSTTGYEVQAGCAPCCLLELGCRVALHPGEIFGCRASIHPNTRDTCVQGGCAARHPAVSSRGLSVQPEPRTGGRDRRAPRSRRGHHPPGGGLGDGEEGAGLEAHDLEGHPEQVALPAPREGRGPGPSAAPASGAPFPVRKGEGGCLRGEGRRGQRRLRLQPPSAALSRPPHPLRAHLRARPPPGGRRGTALAPTRLRRSSTRAAILLRPPPSWAGAGGECCSGPAGRQGRTARRGRRARADRPNP